MRSELAKGEISIILSRLNHVKDGSILNNVFYTPLLNRMPVNGYSLDVCNVIQLLVYITCNRLWRYN